jgi:dihydrofolate synthase/folylpolyglutamate synthase
MLSSAVILENFRRDYVQTHGRDIDLTLRPAYRDLLKTLGDPHKKLPPVFHVAGTNGKGSTCAFLRAMLEAAGYRVHVYTSPHLVRFHERIRVAGKLIEENELAEILDEIARACTPGTISYFEAATVVAFVAFARHPADFTILEVGLGGRLDATNVVTHPLAAIISRLSYDHREFLGDTLSKIAFEKAGIMKQGAPCFVAAQPDAESIVALRAAATEKKAQIFIGGEDWKVEPRGENGFHFKDKTRSLDLPLPSLIGEHQILNAGLAIAALAAIPKPLPVEAIARGLQTVEWPARLQKITAGALAEVLPAGWELWLDGGHNDSAGEVLAQQAARWQTIDKRPLRLIFGMLSTKSPREFLTPLQPFIERIATVDIPDEAQSLSASELAHLTCETGIENVEAAGDVPHALKKISALPEPGRVLICGSLYLAGHVLHLNDA